MIFSIAIFIITLLVLVIVHELGHFLMAKKFGIKVEEFGFGIPPRAWGKKIGETIYSINWLPFGGFVKLLGEDEVDMLTIDKKALNSRDFRGKKVEQRIAVVISGVVMNLILAWILFYAVIIGQNFKIIYPQEPAIYIAGVQDDFPAQKAGVKVGEKLVAVDNQETLDIEQARKLIRLKSSTPIILSLTDSDGKTKREISVTPKRVDNGDVLIGVIFSPIPFREYSTLSQKVFSGITYSWDLTKLTFTGLGKLSQELIYGDFGQVSKSVTGPVGMAAMTNDILSLGGIRMLLPYLWFVGIISLTLSIFNVLPIPALDGGRLLFLVVEAVSRRRVKENVERLVHQIGLALLLALAILITYSDIRKMLP